MRILPFVSPDRRFTGHEHALPQAEVQVFRKKCTPLTVKTIRMEVPKVTKKYPAIPTSD